MIRQRTILLSIAAVTVSACAQHGSTLPTRFQSTTLAAQEPVSTSDIHAVQAVTRSDTQAAGCGLGFLPVSGVGSCAQNPASQTLGSLDWHSAASETVSARSTISLL